jgi:hypothetical protein
MKNCSNESKIKLKLSIVDSGNDLQEHRRKLRIDDYELLWESHMIENENCTMIGDKEEFEERFPDGACGEFDICGLYNESGIMVEIPSSFKDANGVTIYLRSKDVNKYLD